MVHAMVNYCCGCIVGMKQHGVCHNEAEPDGDQRHIRSELGGQRG